MRKALSLVGATTPAAPTPDDQSRPGILNLSWVTGQDFANLALTPEGSDGGVDV
jgi:hypothetical protein